MPAEEHLLFHNLNMKLLNEHADNK